MFESKEENLMLEHTDEHIAIVKVMSWSSPDELRRRSMINLMLAYIIHVIYYKIIIKI